jgi:hypothetical protein
MGEEIKDVAFEPMLPGRVIFWRKERNAVGHSV